MNQENSDISNDDIHRIVTRDFPESEVALVFQTLAQYTGDSEKGRNRIHAAILKLSKGEVERVAEYTMIALHDYRDVIAEAEYPNYSKCALTELGVSERDRLLLADQEQYKQWFNS